MEKKKELQRAAQRIVHRSTRSVCSVHPKIWDSFTLRDEHADGLKFSERPPGADAMSFSPFSTSMPQTWRWSLPPSSRRLIQIWYLKVGSSLWPPSGKKLSYHLDQFNSCGMYMSNFREGVTILLYRKRFQRSSTDISNGDPSDRRDGIWSSRRIREA